MANHSFINIEFFRSISRELVDTVIQTAIVLFKVNVYDSKVNIYGESLNKTWYPGVGLGMYQNF